MKSEAKNNLTATSITGTTVVFDPQDVSAFSTVSCQVFATGTGLTGTAKLVYSNDSKTWLDFPSTQYPNASKAMPSSTGSVMLEVPHVAAGSVALSVQLTAGTASVTHMMLAKEF